MTDESDVVTWPDAEQGVIADLVTNGLGPKAYAEAPRTRPSEFYRVLRTGGVVRDLVIDQAQITVEAWAATPTRAHTLAMDARALVLAMPRRGVTFSGCSVVRVEEFGGPNNEPDPTSDTPRYTFTVSIHVRGTRRGFAQL